MKNKQILKGAAFALAGGILITGATGALGLTMVSAQKQTVSEEVTSTVDDVEKDVELSEGVIESPKANTEASENTDGGISIDAEEGDDGEIRLKVGDDEEIRLQAGDEYETKIIEEAESAGYVIKVHKVHEGDDSELKEIVVEVEDEVRSETDE